MDETSLRVRLDQALSAEPPLGNLVGNSLRAGRGLRRRRLAAAMVLSAAAVLAVSAVPTLLSGAFTTRPAAAPPAARTAYVLSQGGTLVPISLATGAVGKPIKVAARGSIVVSPNGRTLYQIAVSDGDSGGYYSEYAFVIPIDAAANKAERAIATPAVVCPPLYLVRLPHCSDTGVDIAMVPNGKYAYLCFDGSVYRVNTATRAVGKPIAVPAGCGAMVFAADGRDLYVLNPYPEGGPAPHSTTPVFYPFGLVTPIRTATDTALPPIRVPRRAARQGLTVVSNMAITPDGSAAYIVDGVGGWEYANSVIPIDLVTDRALTPVRIKARGLATKVVMSPGGGTVYVLSGRAVTPISTATNRAEPAINLPDRDGVAYDMVLTPNGQTIYALSPRGVIPISTASRTVLPMIRIPDVELGTAASAPFAITPDGRTVYVGTTSGLLPISTASNAAGKVINLSELRPIQSITFAG